MKYPDIILIRITVLVLSLMKTWFRTHFLSMIIIKNVLLREQSIQGLKEKKL